MRTSILILLLLAITACAETDPYKRAEPSPTPAMKPADAGLAFLQRWPMHFKCVQTVTIDFRVRTQTLVGYLVAEEPNRFRLQGMTEQGLKLFDIIYDGHETHIVFAAQEFEAKVIADISRDIRRVFLDNFDATGAVWGYAAGTTNEIQFIEAPHARVYSDETGTRATFQGQHGEMHTRFVGEPPRLDWYDYYQAGRSLFRVDQYEWKDYGDQHLPSIVVLRERGIQSNGPPYKLTIQITDFTARDKPWPDKLFQAKEGG